jgi:hypothetical protein
MSKSTKSCEARASRLFRLSPQVRLVLGQMLPVVLAAGSLALVGLTSCDTARKAECEKFLVAMKPLDEGMPSADAVDRVAQAVSALTLQDQPLSVYRTNYKATLTVLSSTLKLNDTPEAPVGTNDIIKAKLKEARTARVDTERYCAQ